MMVGLDDNARFLAAYDEQLRTDAETQGAVKVTRLGPLHLATFMNGRGFITYQDLEASNPAAILRCVAEAKAYYQADPGINLVEWKIRGHDRANGLHEALLQNGFNPGDPESIMIGAAQALSVNVPLPDGVVLRRVTEETDVRRMSAMQDAVFGDPTSRATADALLQRLSRADGLELWIAESEGRIVSAGRLEPVPGTGFAGIWAGATLKEWRGRGIYRALTARRASSALKMGKTLIHSDSTEFSRPILERAGLVKVSTTTPYVWRR